MDTHGSSKDGFMTNRLKNRNIEQKYRTEICFQSGVKVFVCVSESESVLCICVSVCMHMYMRECVCVCAVRQCLFRTILVAGALEAFLKLQAVRLDTVVPVCLVHERHLEGVPDLSPQHRPWVQDSKHTP